MIIRFVGIDGSFEEIPSVSMGFYTILCPRPSSAPEHSYCMITKDYFSVVSRRFYASIMYIMSQSPQLLENWHTFTVCINRLWAPVSNKHPDTLFIYHPPYLRWMLQLWIVWSRSTATKTPFQSRYGSHQIQRHFFHFQPRETNLFGVKSNPFPNRSRRQSRSRRQKVGLGGKVNRRHRRYTEPGSCRHCGKTGHKEDSYLKMYPELIPDQYTLLEKEAPPTPPKKRLC